MFNTAHLHPMIVHFPIALITFGFLADVFSLFFKSEKCFPKQDFTLWSSEAWQPLPHGVQVTFLPTNRLREPFLNVFEKHETGGLITMILIVIGSAFRIWLVLKKKEETQLKWVAFGLYFLAFAAVGFTGFMGGIMVFNFMM